MRYAILALVLTASSAQAQLYGADSGADTLLSIDPSTGTPTTVGSTAAGPGTPAGLAFDGSDLWTIDLGGGALYVIDPVTAVPTMMGTTGLSGWQGLASDPTQGGQLYAINQSDELWMVSPSSMTMVATGVGNLITGLEFDSSGQLWGSEFSGMLVQIDKMTGVVTTVGPTESGMQGLTWQGSTLYGHSSNSDSLFTIDPMTGTATLVGPCANNFCKGLGALGVACSLTAPMSPASGDIDIPIDTSSPMAMMVDIGWEFSTDAGMTFTPCTASGSSMLPNPATGVATGMNSFTWDSVADGVAFAMVAMGVVVRASVSDGSGMTSCTATFDVDNVIPPPTCTITSPMGTQRDDITLDFDVTSPNAMMVDLSFDYSLDGGMTWLPCTAAATSALSNPALGVATGLGTFLWDSRGDGVGTMALAPGVLLRVTADDGVSFLTGECTSAPFDIDNTALCNGICGDCNVDGMGPNVIDALTAAQAAAGLIMPTTMQAACCDVDSSTTVTVLDALMIAQNAAGLPATLMCL